MKSNKEYKANERQAKREAGLVRLEVWIKPEWKEEIVNLINKLTFKATRLE